MEDSKIIQLFYERSGQAIDELDMKHGAKMRQAALHILGNALDAEECVNDAYLAAWNTIPPEKPAPLLTYVCKLARNLAINRYHANTAKKRNSAYDLVLDELEEFLPNGRGTPAEEYEVRELANAINAFVDRLCYDDRYIFMRRYWYSDPVKEIAAAMHWKSHRVSVRLSRIRKNLKNYLKKEGLL
jgi:RNA polymerase sigma-70 factor (ECF subfamily)